GRPVPGRQRAVFGCLPARVTAGAVLVAAGGGAGYLGVRDRGGAPKPGAGRAGGVAGRAGGRAAHRTRAGYVGAAARRDPAGQGPAHPGGGGHQRRHPPDHGRPGALRRVVRPAALRHPGAAPRRVPGFAPL
ncbi:MAG: hypothetical protein AVDCRST_MAG89-1489, partial [uncultured Gemmatimonadetes bacterium]